MLEWNARTYQSEIRESILNSSTLSLSDSGVGLPYGIWLSKGDPVEVWQALMEATSGDSAVADYLILIAEDLEIVKLRSHSRLTFGSRVQVSGG